MVDRIKLESPFDINNNIIDRNEDFREDLHKVLLILTFCCL